MTVPRTMTRPFCAVLFSIALLSAVVGGYIGARISAAEAIEAGWDEPTGTPAIERAVERGWLVRSDLAYGYVAPRLAISIARGELGQVRQLIVDGASAAEISDHLDTAVEHTQFLVDALGRDRT